jgi:hypothetical protein
MNNDSGSNSVLAWIGWIFGSLFNLLLVIGVLFIMMDITGSRPSAKDNTASPTSVTESK